MEENKALKVKDESYFLIAGWMITKLQLKGNTLMIYAIIYGFSQDGESSFKGSRRYLCDFIGASKPTIDKALEELVERGLIIKESNRINDVLYNTYKVNLDALDFTGGKETLPGGKEIAPNNIEYNIVNKESIINNTKEMEIFDHWNKKNIVIHRGFEKFEKKIKAVLKEHNIEEIKLAIDHYSEILNDNNYFFKYKWGLDEFLSRSKGYTEFLNNGVKWLNYLDFKNKNKPGELSKETSYPEYDDVGYIR